MLQGLYPGVVSCFVSSAVFKGIAERVTFISVVQLTGASNVGPWLVCVVVFLVFFQAWAPRKSLRRLVCVCSFLVSSAVFIQGVV